MPPIISRDAEIDNQLQSPLLRLPGEIRNIIYDYVLDNVKDRINNDYHPQLGLTNFVFMIPHDMHDPESASHAHYLKKGDGQWDKRERYQEINTLKYVCRKLYLDTEGMGAGFFKFTKTVTFPSFWARRYVCDAANYVRMNPTMGVFQRFVRQCSPDILKHLRNIHVELIWPCSHGLKDSLERLLADIQREAIKPIVQVVFRELKRFFEAAVRGEDYHWLLFVHTDGFSVVQVRKERTWAMVPMRVRPLEIRSRWHGAHVGVMPPTNYVSRTWRMSTVESLRPQGYVVELRKGDEGDW